MTEKDTVKHPHPQHAVCSTAICIAIDSGVVMITGLALQLLMSDNVLFYLRLLSSHSHSGFQADASKRGAAL